MNARRLVAAISIGSVSAVTLLSGLTAGAAAADTSTSSTTTTTTTVPGATTTSTTSTPTTPPSSTTSSTTTTVPPTTTTTIAPQSLISEAMDAFASQRAVDWTYKLSAFGVTYSEAAQAGRSDGVEADTVSSGGLTGRVNLILDGKLYLEGNSKGLAQDIGFTASASQEEANLWIAVPKSSTDFALSGGMTVATALNQLLISNKMKTLPPTTINGQPVLAVEETTKSQGITLSDTVYIKATGMPLPVEIVQSVDGLQAKIVYGPWNKPPKTAVPAKSVPFQSSWIAKSS
jgi:hypothetical protein